MITTDKFKDPNLSEEEQDAIIGAFVRQREDAKLKERWAKKLAREHQLVRSPEAPAKKAKIRRLPIMLMTLAVSLLLLLIFLPGLLTESGEDILATNLSQTTLSGTRGLAATGEEAELKALRITLRNAFQAADFPAAVSAAEQVVDMPEADAKDRLNLGLAYLRAERLPDAQRTFRELTLAASDYGSEAQYYLGLSLLAAGDIPAGLEALRQLTEADGGRLYENAQALLKAEWD